MKETNTDFIDDWNQPEEEIMRITGNEIPKTYVSISDGGGYSLVYDGVPVTKSGLSIEQVITAANSYRPRIVPTHIWDGNKQEFTVL